MHMYEIYGQVCQPRPLLIKSSTVHEKLQIPTAAAIAHIHNPKILCINIFTPSLSHVVNLLFFCVARAALLHETKKKRPNEVRRNLRWKVPIWSFKFALLLFACRCERAIFLHSFVPLYNFCWLLLLLFFDFYFYLLDVIMHTHIFVFGRLPIFFSLRFSLVAFSTFTWIVCYLCREVFFSSFFLSSLLLVHFVVKQKKSQTTTTTTSKTKRKKNKEI